jgi:hypothetical protein
MGERVDFPRPSTMFSWWGGCEQITSLAKQPQNWHESSNSRQISPTQLEQMFGSFGQREKESSR